ncbi:nucleotidyltransferase family protein [Pontitalea aquivivens]|uniref:nucleotidyltransferase family protein n=1 Tax=Pontitalea aquivivens TaxID=3388663 RepID=UPI0039709139
MGDETGFRQDASGIAAIVLGAGFGTRFGAGDKLAQGLDGRAVAHHVLRVIDPFRWGARVLVCRDGAGWAGAFADRGFQIRINDQAERGMLGSLHLGAAVAAGCARVAVFLADMPRIDPRHVARLVQLSDAAPDRIVASAAGAYRGPPAIIPTDRLKALPHSGEGGARSLLRDALIVQADAATLADVDTADDLAALHRQAGV